MMTDKSLASPLPKQRLAALEPSSKRLIILAHGFPPEIAVGARRPYHFAKYLRARGYTVEVIAAPHSGEFREPIAVRRVPEDGVKGALRWAGRLFATAERYLLPYHCLFDWTPFAAAAGRKALIQNPGAVVLSTSPPVSAHLAGLWLKMRYGVTWVADCRDPLSGNPFHSSLRARWFDRLLERLIVTKADLVIANTDTARADLARRFPAFADKIKLLWNAYDPEEEVGAEPIPERARRVIAHFGSVYGGRHPGMLLDSLKRLIDRGLLNPSGSLVRLIGLIELEEPWARSSAFSELIERGVLEYNGGFVPRSEAQSEMSRTDYLLLIDLNEGGTSLQVPAKLFEYVRIGRPILALTSKNSPVERILRDCGVPNVCIHPGDPPEEVDRSVLDLLALPQTPVSPSAWFEQQFDARRQAERLAGILQSITSAQPSPQTR